MGGYIIVGVSFFFFNYSGKADLYARLGKPYRPSVMVTAVAVYTSARIMYTCVYEHEIILRVHIRVCARACVYFVIVHEKVVLNRRESS